MPSHSAGPEIDRLIKTLARLPGLGPRSGQRIALHLLKNRDVLMPALIACLQDTLDNVKSCALCGNLDSEDPCTICTDPRRDPAILCVVESVADLWALERSGAFRGRYHVLGGVLSALDGVGPEDLTVSALCNRAASADVKEVILATGATVDGQTTAHYVADRLADCDVLISRPAHGMPLGGELDYLDDGTLLTALRARRPLT